MRELDVAVLALDELASDASVPQEGLLQLRAILQDERQHLFADMAAVVEHVDLMKLQRKTIDAVERSLGDRATVIADGDVVGHWLRDVDGERVLDVRREALGALDDLTSRPAESGRQGRCDFAGDLGRSPNGLGVS